MQIPIIINNRNRLTTTKRLVADLNNLGYTDIYILDNASTYEPLLEWYRQCPATVEYIGRNMGHKALWEYGILNMFKKCPFVVYTDSDIELNSATPAGFIEQMVGIAGDTGVEKVGLAIRIDDIPPTPANQRVYNIERRYWANKVDHPTHEVYEAIVDTSFCIVRPDSSYNWSTKAVRVAGNLTCTHRPWYLDYDNLDAEEQYVFGHADKKFCSYKALLDNAGTGTGNI